MRPEWHVHVSELVIFPIKSLRGVSVDDWRVEMRGLRHDRRWMLVDSDGVFLTQRKLHEMALFDVALLDEGLRVSRGESCLEVPFEPEGGDAEVQVWRSTVQAKRVSSRADAWFTEQLGIPCSLAYMPEDEVRHVSADEARPGDIVGFADACPILVAGQASLDDLNGRLASPVPMRRFRANIVVSGGSAFEEDEWPSVRIEGVSLRRIKRDGRCLVTTIDIETAKSSDEPLRTLASYRKFGTHACFGSYYAAGSLGVVKVGDSVEVAST